MKPSNHKPQPVDFRHNACDFQAAILGSLGFGNRFIGAKTGLTSGQINYRLRRADISRRSYRNGENEQAQLVLRTFECSLRDKIAGRGPKHQLVYSLKLPAPASINSQPKT